jgi:hypothetical protein
MRCRWESSCSHSRRSFRLSSSKLKYDLEDQEQMRELLLALKEIDSIIGFEAQIWPTRPSTTMQFAWCVWLLSRREKKDVLTFSKTKFGPGDRRYISGYKKWKWKQVGDREGEREREQTASKPYRIFCSQVEWVLFTHKSLWSTPVCASIYIYRYTDTYYIYIVQIRSTCHLKGNKVHDSGKLREVVGRGHVATEAW